MADYYDRLEAQLADLTERGAHRRWVARRPDVPGIRGDLVAVAAAVLLVVAVSAAFLSLGTSQRLARPAHHVGGGGNGIAVIRNFRPNTIPASSGPFVSDTALQPPGGGKFPSGKAQVNAKPPNRVRDLDHRQRPETERSGKRLCRLALPIPHPGVRRSRQASSRC